MKTYGRVALVVLLAHLALTGSAPAQARGGAVALGPDSFLVVVPIRDTADLQRELGAALQSKIQADSDRARAERLRTSAKARIDRKNSEINAIKNREKVAKDQKRRADVIALEADRKAAEREKDLLQRRESLRESDIELGKKRGELADARRQALELELQLAIRRLEQQRSGNTGGPAAAGAEQVLSDLEKRTLEAQQKEVDKTREVADRQKQIIQRRLQIWAAQRKLIAGR